MIFDRHLRHLAGAALAAAIGLGGLGAAPALAAQLNLPPAKLDVWTSHKINRGAVAQVNSRGEGRFAVICTKADRKGALIYLPPVKDRGQLRGRPINVVFNFDKGREKIERQLSWSADGFWYDPFGPNSNLAEWMKRAYRVRINVKGHKGVDSDFTLQNSWSSITRMFEICD